MFNNSNNSDGRSQRRAQPESPADLKRWLTAKGIDLSQWGQGPSKSVENLWDELVNGEMYLQDEPALRVVPVVQIIIRRGDYILIETIQEFADKRQRFRDHPPSEKMQPGESYLEAAKRCLREELGVTDQDIEILANTHQTKTQQRESPSYPGLRTQYLIHIVEANVAGLPETNFWTHEAEHNRTDVVKRHYWAWEAEADSKIF